MFSFVLASFVIFNCEKLCNIESVVLRRFLPRLTRAAFEDELSSLDSVPDMTDGMEQSVTCKTCFYVIYLGLVVNVNLFCLVLLRVHYLAFLY